MASYLRSNFFKFSKGRREVVVSCTQNLLCHNQHFGDHNKQHTTRQFLHKNVLLKDLELSSSILTSPEFPCWQPSWFSTPSCMHKAGSGGWGGGYFWHFSILTTWRSPLTKRCEEKRIEHLKDLILI